ncbi:MAG: cell surface protein SprA [Bacteroidia bacterium]|nr:cell surface protein SprA [Bacteroidia bacterium]
MRLGKSIIYTGILVSSAAIISWVMADKPLPGMYVPAAQPFNIPFYNPALKPEPLLPDSGKTKNDTLKFPFTDRYSDPISSQYHNSPLFLSDPSNIKTQVTYDPNSNQYNINEMIGDEFYRNPSYLTYEEYLRKSNNESTKKYWKQLAEGGNSISGKRGLNPRLYVGSEVFERIFGSNTIDIRPQGSAELTFGANIATNRNPAIPTRQQRVATFDFKQKIQLNVVGNIGDKMKLSTNYNTEASFDFENTMKLEYTGHDDDIIKKIEAGNVTLPLTGTLITGSQSLFGFKTQLQFGKLVFTGLFSQQKGKSQVINVPPGGGQKTDFEVTADNYEANRHFFLGQYFRNRYDEALKNAPQITSPVIITKCEVWVVKPGLTDTRSLIGFADLGEDVPLSQSPIVQSPNPIIPGALPNNFANNLYANMSDTTQVYYNLRNPNYANATAVFNDLTNQGFVAPRDYERIENAVKLQPNEFTLNPTLGYISLKSQLNPNQVLAVAYEYSHNGQIYRVGDLTIAGINPPNRLFVKILKSTNVNQLYPVWDLMMKNIYSLGAYGLTQKDFFLNVLYYNDSTGADINFLGAGATEPDVNGIPLIRVLNLDRVNSQRDPQPDGVFDYIEGLTINSNDGRIIFPVVEPFGSYLRSKFNPNTNVYQKYVYQELYDSSKTAAQQIPEKNKFKIKGSYVSNISSEISLNAINIPQGSVKVSAGGIPLTENVDFTVDYNLGRVKIINQAYLNAASPISVTLESNSLFSIQSKRLMGLHVDYLHSKDFTLGGTILNLTERPLTQKINIGDEPISNTIVGVDGNYRTESRFITKLIDRLPFLETKEVSNVAVSGEYAHFFPGHPKVIGRTGTSYLDDFEGTQSNIDLTTAGSWSLASPPQNQPTLFPETTSPENRVFGVNRAKLAWYQIDPTVFYSNSSLRPASIPDEQLQNNQVRQVFDNELFPQKNYPNGIAPPLRVLNLAYYPTERGPYNYDVSGVPGISAGINPDGKLLAPASRWGGMMRNLQTNDFEIANVEFITFWLMDPFNEDNPNAANNKGKLYFNLGQISEDILHDGFRLYENGLPSNTLSSQVNQTSWGYYPTNTTNPTNAFDNDNASRAQQDVGFDGLPTDSERVFQFTKQLFLDSIVNQFGTGSQAYTLANTDPSTDNFRFFRGNTTSDTSSSILFRYRDFNGTEGNSPVATGAYVQASTNLPDAEDINRDNNMDIYENYFQYEVDIDPAKLVVGQNYITDRLLAPVKSDQNPNKKVYWYQFKVPISNYTRKVGDIADFKSVGYMRMFLKGFDQDVVLRFGRLDLQRGEWRRYLSNVGYQCDNFGTNPFADTQFDVAAVSIEENSGRSPIHYVTPPGIVREVNAQTQQVQQLNEQSLSLRLCNLQDGDGRATFRNMQADVRSYKKIKMFVHAESFVNQPAVNDNDLVVFVRIGSDLTENFYEYEMPLKMSPLYNNNPNSIWPEENNMEIELDKLLRAKQMRQQALQTPGSGITIKTYYQVPDGKNTIYVVGSPNLMQVRTVMIGVRNPRQNCPLYPAYNNDDGLAKCAEVWVNELRLTDFDESGGWAANARVTTKLANLGTLSLSGLRRTIGFGMIEQKVNDRSRDDITSYDLSTTLELGRFFPEKSGLSIPVYFGFAEQFIKPQFDPLQPDIPLEVAIDAAANEEEKRKIKTNSIDYTRRKGFNVTNLRKTKTGGGGKSMPWDIENFNVTYAFTEVYHRNVNLQYDILKNHRALLGYNFNTTIKPIEPFKKSQGLKSKWMRVVKDFNFTPLPSSFNFNTSMDRQYGEQLLRNNTSYPSAIDTTFNKFWNWTRNYDLKWDLTKSLKFDFNAANISRVDEPNGRIDNSEERDIIRKNIYKGGRTVDYRQSGNLSYQVPLNKIPLLDWTSLNVRYAFDYSWLAAPSVFDSTTRSFKPNPILQNTIQNSNNKQANLTLTMTQLYNKIPFFKRLTSNAPPAPKPKPEPPKSPNDTSKTAKPAVPKAPSEINPIIKFAGKMVLMVKTIGVTFSETNGTALPGFKPRPQILGQDLDWKATDGSNSIAPGFGFGFGDQSDIRVKAARNNWLTTDTLFNGQYARSFTQSFTGRSTLEPFTSCRIELNVQRNFTRNQTESYRINANTGEYNAFNSLDGGSFSITTITWRTAFVKNNKDYTNETFTQFTNNRAIISQRLGLLNPYSTGQDSTGFWDGYSGTNPQVLAGAFLSAYRGKNAANINLNYFPTIPLPNWRITYDGLTKMAWSKKIFQNFQLSHAYRSTYNVNAYNTNLQWSNDGNDHSPIRDLSRNFIPRYDIAQVSLMESFSPLLGLDMTFKGPSQFNLRIEYKRDRSLSLTYTGAQLTEIRGSEFSLGTGYRINNFKLPFKINGAVFRNDLVLNLDISYRKSLNILRRVIEQTNIPSSGLNTFSIKFDADYVINERFSVRFYWDTNINRPVIATSYPNSNTAFGFSVRFSLSQ